MKTPPNKPVLEEWTSLTSPVDPILNKFLRGLWYEFKVPQNTSNKVWQEARNELKALIDQQISATLDLVEGALPKVNKLQRNGHKRAFSTNPVWEYGDVYLKAERNYRAKALEAIKSVRKELK